MKTLVLHSELGVLRGGGENFTRNLFAAFAQRGHCISAAFVADRRNRYAFPLPPEIEPIPLSGWWSNNFGQAALAALKLRIPGNGRGLKEWDRIQEACAWRTFRWHDRRFQRRVMVDLAACWRKFDVVYVHGSPYLAREVARFSPTVLRLPGPVGAELKPILEKAHAVCANGDALARIRGFLGDHAIELPIGIDRQLFKPGPTSVRSALGWTDQHMVVGYVGRLTHLKGVDILAQAFRIISRHLPSARLLIVGSGAEESSIRPLLAKELSRGVVHIEPDVSHEDLPEWYRAMDLFVMPSRYENFSNAVLESMACGIPVIASDIGGNRLLATAGVALLFTHQSIDSLIECLSTLLPRPTELKERGYLGARYVRQHHSWAASAARLENILHSLIGVKR